MFARRPPLLLAFAGGCLSGAALILSGIGAVSIWRGETAASSPERARDRRDQGSETRVATSPAITRERTLATPTTKLAVEELGHEPAVAHASDDVGADRPTDSGRSVADVLTRLEAAYRQGLVDGARASEGHAAPSASVEPQPGESASGAEGPHAVAGREEPAAPAAGNSTAVATASPVAEPAPSQPAVIAVPAPPITVAVITPPADVPPAASPAPALGAGAAPVAAPPDAGQSHDGYASVTQNIHIDNLHQGDVYQQLAVMQYMQLFAGSPYGAYPGYVPAPVAPAHHHSTATSSPFSTPALPVAAPPFPSFLTSLTNPANPYPTTQHRAGRAFR